MSQSVKAVINATPDTWLEDGFIYKSNNKYMWYSVSLDQSFYIPDTILYGSNFHLQNRKLYYTNIRNEFVEYNPINEISKVLIEKSPNQKIGSECGLGSSYIGPIRGSYINIKSGKLFINSDNDEWFIMRTDNTVITVKFMKSEESNDMYYYEYEIIGYRLSDETILFTIKKQQRTRCISRYSDLDSAKHDIINIFREKSKFINGNLLFVDNVLYRIKEKIEKPRCLVCHGKFKDNIRCITLPCEHKACHYDCVLETCPECKVEVTKKIKI